MGTVLYKVDKNSGEVYSIFVSGIDQNVKGYVVQKFTCTHGAWSAFYNNGVVTYPKGDWRHGRVDRFKIKYNVSCNLWEFEQNQINKIYGGK